MKSAACPSSRRPWSSASSSASPTARSSSTCASPAPPSGSTILCTTLTPGAVLELFADPQAPRPPPRPLADAMKCPTVPRRARAHQRHPAHQPHRLLPLHQRARPPHHLLPFLREKNFVRDLTKARSRRSGDCEARCAALRAASGESRKDPCLRVLPRPISILDSRRCARPSPRWTPPSVGVRIGDPQEIVDGLLAGKRGGSAARWIPRPRSTRVIARQRTGRRPRWRRVNASPARRRAGPAARTAAAPRPGERCIRFHVSRLRTEPIP